MNNFLHEIEKKLKAVVEREKRKNGLNKLAVSLSSGSFIVLFFILAEAAGNFNSSTRSVLFFLLLALLALITLILAYPAIKDFIYFTHPDYVETAKKVGGEFPEIKDELANAIQLIYEKNNFYSPSLINASFENVYKKSRSLDFNKVIDFSNVKRKLQISGLIVLSVILSIFIVPGINSAAYRLINYSAEFIPPQKFYFTVEPGNKEITKGASVSIKIRTTGKPPENVALLTKSTEQSEYVEKKLSQDSTGAFNFEAAVVKSSFYYFASAEGIKSKEYKITVINRPVISNYDVTISPPAYSMLPETTQKDNGNIIALRGSRVKINIFSSRELSKASVAFGDSSVKSLTVFGETAVTEFNIISDNTYRMLITDKQGFSNRDPITYSIKTIADKFPEITLTSPDLSNEKANQPIRLSGDSKLSIISKIKDDYGFTKLNLSYRLSASRYRQPEDQFIQFPISINKNLKEDEVYYVWDISPLVLAEGEALSCYLEIFDNDFISGPKSAKTQMFTIQIPSMDEIFTGAEDTQEEASKEIAETFKDAEQLQREMQKIADDLKQNNREITWQEKDRVEKAVEKFKELADKVDQASQKLSEMQNELMQNNLLSKETLDKYNELQKLLDEMTSNEMKEALQRMQESLKNLMRENVQASMEELKANEDYFKKSLERTLNLLKRVQVEQKIDELIKRTEELTKQLDELKNKTGQSNLTDQQKKNELAKRQQNISGEMKDLKDEMNNLNEKMSDLKDIPKDQLERAMNDFEKQNNEELSEEAVKDLQKMQKMQAMQNQQQLSQNMQSMNKKFSDMRSAMQQMNQMKTFFDMMKILDDLITLSKSQEELKNKTDQAGQNLTELQKGAHEQSVLRENLKRVLQNMSALSQKSFSITPEMGNAIGKAQSQMQLSITSMQNQNGAASSQFQKQSMQHLNEAANLLKSGMEQMMSGGQSGGMMSLMQQMQQLSQQQMQLNQLTQMMNQGKLTKEMASQMQRLARQQEMIRKSLEQMNQEARESGQSKKLAANLEKILQDMKEVVTNLQSEKVDDNLIKQQEKILSRLLDAQRSVNERDFEKNRKSETGQNTTRNTPPNLILSTDEGKNKLRDELLKAIREGYKKDYEYLIRKYFESLENSSNK